MPNFKPLVKLFKRMNRKLYIPASEWMERPAHQWATLGGIGSLGLLHQAATEGRRKAEMERDLYAPYMDILSQYPGDAYKMGAAVDVRDTAVKMPRAEDPLVLAKNVKKPENKTTQAQPETNSGITVVSSDMSKEAILDEGLGPVAWGVGGGAAGYAGSKYIINPLLKHKENKILEQIAKGEKAVSGLRALQKIGPLATTTLGALLLAAIAAKISRNKTREEMRWMAQRYGPAANAYQVGTNPQDIMSMNDPRAQQGSFY